MRIDLTAVFLAGIVALAAIAAADLRRAEQKTLVLYTTPALRDLLESDIIPRFEQQHGAQVEPVYVAAGEQYNRLRLSGTTPEADLFLHASPLYLEKGATEGHFEAFRVEEGEALEERFRSREVEGGRIWYSFAWTPLVEVYSPSLAEPPDLATSDVTFGFAHPRLANNGVYVVLFFELLDPGAGHRLLARANVQPVDARSTVIGVADRSFDVTLGYESVTLLFQGRGAKVATALPRLDREDHLLPVTFSVGVVKHHQHDGAEEFVRFLFTNETQSRLAQRHLRSVLPDMASPEGGADTSGAEPLRFDWSRWAELETKLPEYEVRT